MIIFKTDTEIAGFLSPGMRIINDLNPNEYQKNNLYYESPMIMTKNEVVKYYEHGDHLYSFSVDLSDQSNIKLDITHELVFVTEPENVPVTVKSESLIEISESEVLDLIELAKIEKIELNATIT